MIPEKIDELCKDTLHNCVEVICTKGIRDPEFKLAVNSIEIIIDYLSSCRKENER
jgi:hypothetical protein